jgi:plastocyanin
MKISPFVASAALAIFACMPCACSSWSPLETPLATTPDGSIAPDVSAMDDASDDVTQGPNNPYSGPPLNNCMPSNFVDRSDPAADRTIYFGGTGTSADFTYDPPCMHIAAGQMVTFVGSFANHPLSPGTGATTTTAGSANNPIQPLMDSQSDAVKFPATGTYPFFCQFHVSIGMAGVVEVE